MSQTSIICHFLAASAESLYLGLDSLDDDDDDDDESLLLELEQVPSNLNYLGRSYYFIRRKFFIFRKKMGKVARNPKFDAFINIAIITNTTLLSLEYHGMPEMLRDLIGKANFVRCIYRNPY